MTRSAACRAPVVPLLILLQTVMLAAAPVRPAEAQRGCLAVTRRFDAFAASARVVGGTAALVREGRIVARHHYGFADRASGRRVGDSTLFHWASVTKTLAAIAVLQLRDRGLLSLDNPITRWVPELREVHAPARSGGRVKGDLHSGPLLGAFLALLLHPPPSVPLDSLERQRLRRRDAG